MTDGNGAIVGRRGGNLSPGAPVVGRAVWLLLCPLVVSVVAGPGSTQRSRDEDDTRLRRDAVGYMPAYCSMVEVEKTQLSNAAIITISANGLLRASAEMMDFVEEDEPGEYDTKPLTRLPIRIENARSELGSFVDINLYPISHLEMTIPPDATEGIGLELTVVLFTLGYARRIELTDFEYYGYISSREARGARDVPVEILISENQRDIIIIARSDRYIDVEHEREPRRIRPPKARLGVGYQNGLLYVHAVSVTAAQLLDEIGKQTGSKISLAEPSPAVASMHLEDMTLTDALDSIARAYGLIVASIDGGYVLASGWPTGGAPYSLATQRAFPIRYLRAEEAADLLPNVLDRYTHVDRDQNAVVAAGSSELLDKIGADLAVLDRPPPMIEVEAIMVDAAREYDFAAELDLQFGDGTTSFASASRTGDISFRIVGDPPQRIRARLSALEQRGVVRTRAKTRVTAWNGEYVRVFGGVLQYFPFRTTRGRRGRQEITLEQAEVGVRLSGYFYTGGEGAILSQMYLRADNIVSASPEGLPFVARRYARTTVQLADGDTIYVGGLTLRQSETRHRKLPVLGDLPLLGRLFRSRRKVVNDRSLAVFLTARIADDATGAARRRATADAGPAPVAQWRELSDTLPESEGSSSG